MFVTAQCNSWLWKYISYMTGGPYHTDCMAMLQMLAQFSIIASAYYHVCGWVGTS